MLVHTSQTAAKVVAQKKGRGSRMNSGHSAASLGIPSLGVPMAGVEVAAESEEEVR